MRAAPPRCACRVRLPEFDAEGRYVEADFGACTVVSLYVPSGSSSSPERQAAKFRFIERFLPHLVALRRAAARSCCAATGTSRTSRST
jgi:exodeoxyribonuclease III